MKIRKAKLKDLTQIVDCGLALLKYHHEIDSYFSPDKNAKVVYQKFFKKCIYSNKSYLLVAENQGIIVGYAVGGIYSRMAFFKIKQIGSINDMFVKEEFRNAGIARFFLVEMKKWFKYKKIKYIELSMHMKNELGRKVWLKYGFKDYMIKQRVEISKLKLK